MEKIYGSVLCRDTMLLLYFQTKFINFDCKLYTQDKWLHSCFANIKGDRQEDTHTDRKTDKQTDRDTQHFNTVLVSDAHLYMSQRSTITYESLKHNYILIREAQLHMSH